MFDIWWDSIFGWRGIAAVCAVVAFVCWIIPLVCEICKKLYCWLRDEPYTTFFPKQWYDPEHEIVSLPLFIMFMVVLYPIFVSIFVGYGILWVMREIVRWHRK